MILWKKDKRLVGHRKAEPLDRCVSCLNDHTTTIVVMDGDAAFHVAALERLGALPRDRAQATMYDNFRNVYGFAPDAVLEEGFLLDFRLCQECAAKTGAEVVSAKDVFDGKPAPVYVQPPPSRPGRVRLPRS